MRTLILLAAIPALMGAASPPAETLQGEWRNTLNTVHLSVKPCGDALCGSVTWASDEQRAAAKRGSGQDIVGRVLLRDLRRNDNGTWRGKAFIPAINSSASATVTQLSNNLMRVTGCTLMGLACKTQHWHRI